MHVDGEKFSIAFDARPRESVSGLVE